MSEKERPLHVRVAAALNLFAVNAHDFLRKQEVASPPPYTSYRCVQCDGYWGHPEDVPETCPCTAWPVRYDQDWAATGPLIEKFNLTLIWDLGWCAFTEVDTTIGEFTCNGKWAKGETPLEAVCNLLLILKEAGKLDA